MSDTRRPAARWPGSWVRLLLLPLLLGLAPLACSDDLTGPASGIAGSYESEFGDVAVRITGDRIRVYSRSADRIGSCYALDAVIDILSRSGSTYTLREQGASRTYTLRMIEDGDVLTVIDGTDAEDFYEISSFDTC